MQLKRPPEVQSPLLVSSPQDDLCIGIWISVMSHYPETGYWYWSSSLHYDRDQLVHVVNEGTKQESY